MLVRFIGRPKKQPTITVLDDNDSKMVPANPSIDPHSGAMEVESVVSYQPMPDEPAEVKQQSGCGNEFKLSLEEENAKDALLCFQDSVKISATIGGAGGAAAGAGCFGTLALPTLFCTKTWDDKWKLVRLAANAGGVAGLYSFTFIGASAGVLFGFSAMGCAYLKGRPVGCDTVNEILNEKVVEHLIEQKNEEEKRGPCHLSLDRKKAENALSGVQDSIKIGATVGATVIGASSALICSLLALPSVCCTANTDDKYKYVRMARNAGGAAGGLGGGVAGATAGVTAGCVIAPCFYLFGRPQRCDTVNTKVNQVALGLLIGTPENAAPPAPQQMM